MMKIRTFKEEDAVTINRWLVRHEHSEVHPQDLSQFGYLVFTDSMDIAAGCLTKTENGIGILDSYVTNPDASKKERNDALDLLTEHILKEGRSIKCKRFMAWTRDESIIKRSLQHGFKISDNTLIMKE